MISKIIVPKLGVSTEPLLIVEWKAAEGDMVEKGAVVLVVETEKIRHDIEAEISGYLRQLVAEGDEAPIGSAAGYIAETKEEFATLPQSTTPEAPKPADAAAPAAVVQVSNATPAPVTSGGRIKITPVARKIAEEHQLDISTITGSGPGGRIVRQDVLQAIQNPSLAAASGETHDGKQVKAKLPLTGIRKAVAEHMHRSLTVAAQLTVMGEIDMVEIVKLRQSLLAQEDAIGTRISYTDLLVFVLARVLKEYPMVNASIVDNQIVQWADINIAVAVATDDGLIVPVVKHADQKSLSQLSLEIKTLSSKARERTLEPDEVKGGTFTITNLGALGGGYRFETVIINQPESGILGVGGITDRPAVRDGQIVIRPIMTYYFTYDHRAMNGADAARFMGKLVAVLENPVLLLA